MVMAWIEGLITIQFQVTKLQLYQASAKPTTNRVVTYYILKEAPFDSVPLRVYWYSQEKAQRLPSVFDLVTESSAERSCAKLFMTPELATSAVLQSRQKEMYNLAKQRVAEQVQKEEKIA